MFKRAGRPRSQGRFAQGVARLHGDGCCRVRPRCPMTPWLTVVGMGDDGPDGLTSAARAVVDRARVVVGGQRHLDLLGLGERESIAWPKPFNTLNETLERLRGREVCVLATGDPTCYGVGSILADAFGLEAVRIIPAPSAFSLACARLGWAAQGVQTLSLHGRPPALLQPFIQPGVRLLALSANADTPGEVARMLRGRGYGGSRLTVLSHLGARGSGCTRRPQRRIGRTTRWRI